MLLGRPPPHRHRPSLQPTVPPAAVAHLRPGEDVTLTFAGTHTLRAPHDLQATVAADPRARYSAASAPCQREAWELPRNSR